MSLWPHFGTYDRFLMRLTKDDSEINLDNDEADVEFAEWKWANPEEVVEQVFSDTRLIMISKKFKDQN